MLSYGASVWKVSHNNHVLYIGGTLHLLSPEDFPLPDAYATAYNASSTLVFETDIAGLSSPAFQRDTLAKLTYQDGTRLQDVLSEKTFSALTQYLLERDIAVTSFNHYKPALVSVTLNILELKQLGLTSQGVDEFYFYKAMTDAKQLEWFESPQQQLGYIASLGGDDGDQVIQYALEDVKQIKDSIGELKQLWRSGDMDTMTSTTLNEFESTYPSVFNTLLTQRNKNWMPMLEDMMASPQTEFVLVGTMHLAGDNSVLTMLQQQGYTIEQLD